MFNPFSELWTAAQALAASIRRITAIVNSVADEIENRHQVIDAEPVDVPPRLEASPSSLVNGRTKRKAVRRG